MSCVSTRQMSWLSTWHMSYVSALRYAQCSQPTQRRRPSAASAKGGGLRPPHNFVVSFVLALNTGHILVFRRKTCALLRAKTFALLRRAACAVLRARTYASFRANTKVAAFGRHHRRRGGLRPPPPFVVSFVLAVSTGHILVLRRKACALLRAKTSALLRRKTCAVLRARTCALFRVNAK